MNDYIEEDAYDLLHSDDLDRGADVDLESDAYEDYDSFLDEKAEYDDFEEEMKQAGWNLSEIEATWQKHEVKPTPFNNPNYSEATASAIWAKETLNESY